ncbi:MAG: non-canonical purine NTP pyrophosphatase [Gemmatimonadales bacterium]
MKLLVATRSAGKQVEMRVLLASAGVEAVFPDDQGLWEQPDEIGLEDQSSFEGNARRKADYFAKRSPLPTLADDSGLEVFALGGAPGVHSRHFAVATAGRTQEQANNDELTRRLAGAPEARRRARYRCVLVYLERPSGVPHVFTGECAGRVLDAPVGAGGFGYDPLFFSDELAMTFGEATAAAKHQVSHRGRAVSAFLEWLGVHGAG